MVAIDTSGCWHSRAAAWQMETRQPAWPKTLARYLEWIFGLRSPEELDYWCLLCINTLTEISYKVIPNVWQKGGRIVEKTVHVLHANLCLFSQGFPLAIAGAVQGKDEIKDPIGFGGYLAQNDPGASPCGSSLHIHIIINVSVFLQKYSYERSIPKDITGPCGGHRASRGQTGRQRRLPLRAGIFVAASSVDDSMFEVILLGIDETPQR